MTFSRLDLLFFIFLLLALVSGWWLGRRERKKKPLLNDTGNPLQRDYFIGLNYLLNEQPDAAIETFVKALEVNSDTVETHIALGNLFRARGESDRAVQIHQNLFARPSLNREQAERVQLELARDFMAAGLYDRAERLLLALTERHSTVGQTSHRLLIDLYEREKEWQKAINCLTGSLLKEYPQLKVNAAHYSCELASELLTRNQFTAAKKQLKLAQRFNPACIRTSLLTAQIELQNGSPKAAIRLLLRIPEQNPDFIPVMLQPLVDAYHKLGQQQELLQTLQHIFQQHPYTSVLLQLAETLRSLGQPGEALDKVDQRMRYQASLKGVDYLIGLYLDTAQGQGRERERLLTLQGLTHQLLQQKPEHQCAKCGFQSKQLYWQCPKCREWGSIKPIVGVEGE